MLHTVQSIETMLKLNKNAVMISHTFKYINLQRHCLLGCLTIANNVPG